MILVSFLYPFLFLLAQEYLDHVVDESVVTAAVDYLLINQRNTGKFDLIGQSHNHYLLVSIFAL